MAVPPSPMITGPRYCEENLSSDNQINVQLQTFLVTGGLGSRPLSSTELLVEGSSHWVKTGNLPTPLEGLRGANIDNRVLMTG